MATSPAPRASAGDEPTLSIRGLTVSLLSDQGRTEVTRDVSLDVEKGRVTALGGESGSGKSVTAVSVLALLPAGGRIERGSITFRPRATAGLSSTIDLAQAKERVLRDVRGGEIGLVFQEPMSALNPVLTIGAQIIEAIRFHRSVGHREARRDAIAWLRRMGMPEPERRIDSYPHELSGGMRQRALIAMALAPRPMLLLLDEPTSALDRSVEAEILDVLATIQREEGLGMLFVSHDLAVVSEIADRVAVMYAGEIVEEGATCDVLRAPRHPYTRALLEAVPRHGARPPRTLGDRPAPLATIPGSVPSPRDLPRGCRFQDRCPRRFDACTRGDIPLFDVDGGKARCLLIETEGPPRSKRHGLALEAEDE